MMRASSLAQQGTQAQQRHRRPGHPSAPISRLLTIPIRLRLLLIQSLAYFRLTQTTWKYSVPDPAPNESVLQP